MAPGDDPTDAEVMPALLRAARRTYGTAIRAALAEVDCDDVPRNGPFVIGAISRAGSPLERDRRRAASPNKPPDSWSTPWSSGVTSTALADPADRRRLTVALTERGRLAAAVSDRQSSGSTRRWSPKWVQTTSRRPGPRCSRSPRSPESNRPPTERVNAPVAPVGEDTQRIAEGAQAPRWAAPVLAAITAVAAVSYTWGSAHGSLEPYYQAAVRSMGSSWHDFAFGAFDPAGTITVDKLPGALWVQALSVRVLGFHPWAIILPQIVEGTVTVLVLYRAVRRLAGYPAGMVAAAVVAVTPATVALDRGNISDSLLILLLVLAANSTVTALVTGNGAWLLATGLWVGLAFQAKMLEAWLILPAIGLVWLAAGAGRPFRRMLDVGAAIGLAAVISLSWMVAVSLVPEAARPYVDGSTHDSLFQQVFVYNGFGRVGSVARSLGGGSTVLGSLGEFRLPGGHGPFRLLTGAGGRDIGWLIPLAVLAALAVVVARRGRGREHPLRAGVILFGSWLAIDAIAFSALSGINAYYLAALTPAIGAPRRWDPEGWCCGPPPGPWSRGPVGSGATVLYGFVLSGPAATAVLAFVWCGAIALLAGGWWLLLDPLARRAGTHDPPPTGRRLRTLVGVGLVLGAMALPSLTAAGEVVASGLGPFDTPYEPAGIVHITQTEPREALTSIAAGSGLLLRVNRSDRYVAATYTSIIAAPLIIDTGAEIEPIGGFTGSIPSPTLAALGHQVQNRELQTVITPTVDDPRVQWVRSHCAPVPQSTGAFAVHGPIAGIGIYFCTARAHA